MTIKWQSQNSNWDLPGSKTHVLMVWTVKKVGALESDQSGIRCQVCHLSTLLNLIGPQFGLLKNGHISAFLISLLREWNEIYITHLTDCLKASTFKGSCYIISLRKRWGRKSWDELKIIPRLPTWKPGGPIFQNLKYIIL